MGRFQIPARFVPRPPRVRLRSVCGARLPRASNGGATVDIQVESVRRSFALRGFRERQVAAVQAAFYLSTGVWPLVHRRSFERVTGPKSDFWLAQTVGVTVAAIGAGLAQAAAGGRDISPELRTIACASAAGLALIDLIFVARRRISPAYLLDAAAEAGLIAAWARARGQ